MWGDWLLVNVQWALFRYQQSEYGTSLILGYKDLLYIYLGQTTGFYNIAAALFWTAGVAIFLIGLIITIIAIREKKYRNLKTASYFTISGGIFLGISALSRFTAGFAIPVGVPIILVIGWWMYRENFEPGETGKESNLEETSVPNKE
jgi:putative Mn2+ efflux pump MntP